MTQAARIQKLEVLLGRVQNNAAQARPARLPAAAAATARADDEQLLVASESTATHVALAEVSQPVGPADVAVLDEVFAAEASPIEDVELLDEDILDLTEGSGSDQEQIALALAEAEPVEAEQTVVPTVEAAAIPEELVLPPGVSSELPPPERDLEAELAASPELPTDLASSPHTPLLEEPVGGTSLSLASVAPASVSGWSEPPVAAPQVDNAPGTELPIGSAIIEEAEIPPEMPIGVSGAAPTEEQLGQVVELEAPIGPALELDHPPSSVPTAQSDELEAELVLGGAAGAAIPADEPEPSSPQAELPLQDEEHEPEQVVAPIVEELESEQPVQVSAPVVMLRGPVVQLTNLSPSRPATFQQWVEDSLAL